MECGGGNCFRGTKKRQHCQLTIVCAWPVGSIHPADPNLIGDFKIAGEEQQNVETVVGIVRRENDSLQYIKTTNASSAQLSFRHATNW